MTQSPLYIAFEEESDSEPEAARGQWQARRGGPAGLRRPNMLRPSIVYSPWMQVNVHAHCQWHRQELYQSPAL